MALAEYYVVIKASHVGLAMLSVGVFSGRAVGVLLGSTAPLSPLVRRISIAIDTALLIAALMLLATLDLNPFTTPWLSVKLVLLAAYICLGMLALKRARTNTGKAAAFAAALICFSMIVQVARTHDPWGGLF